MIRSSTHSISFDNILLFLCLGWEICTIGPKLIKSEESNVYRYSSKQGINSKEECFTSCWTDARCKAYTYRLQNSLCRLSDHTAEDIGFELLQPRDGGNIYCAKNILGMFKTKLELS